MKPARPYVLSVAGFDPSSGAGITADIKTFEANKVYGLGAVTSITFQHEEKFESVKWLSAEELNRQVHLVAIKYKPVAVKIGLIRDMDTLNQVVTLLMSIDPLIKIIWDPVLKSSTGFEIHNLIEETALANLCKNIFLITPNYPEAQRLTGEPDGMKAAEKLQNHCNVLLKGGHNEKEKGKDYLFTKEGKRFAFNPGRAAVFPKHGSGCVLSSSIAAQLAKGYKLHAACLRGKRYTENFLGGSPGLLGYHKK